MESKLLEFAINVIETLLLEINVLKNVIKI